jgi:hypothetical protein
MPGRDVYHSPPSSPEVKNEISCTSAACVCLHGANREFNFFRPTRPLSKAVVDPTNKVLVTSV